VIDQLTEAVRQLLADEGFKRKFVWWARTYPALAVDGAPESLIRLLNAPRASRVRLLPALVHLVAEGDRDASLLLLWLLGPAITRRTHRLVDERDREDAWAEVAAEVLWVARHYDPERHPAGVAHDLLHAAERRAGRTLSKASVEGPVDLPVAAPSTRTDTAVPPFLVEAVERGVISEQDACLIWLTRVEGYSLAELAGRGAYDQVRMQRRRAERGLRIFLERFHPELFGFVSGSAE